MNTQDEHADLVAQIESIALRDPVVYTALRLHQEGRISWEKALVWMVQFLVKRYDVILERLTAQLTAYPAPVLKLEK